MNTITPASAEELAEGLGTAARHGKSIRLGGRFSKDRLGGPIAPADVTVSTAGLCRVLQYNPGDLTISVEAGLPYVELNRLLAEHRQMVPLDPPFAAHSTVGGVVACNLSGPRRRFYGTARDLVIGMRFATLEGKLVQSGGMVVKNAAGLDFGKLLVGSFGTLAAMAVVNFRVFPMPAATRTFLVRPGSLEEAISARDGVLQGPLRPLALDLLNPDAARFVGEEGYTLALQAGGSPVVLDRFAAELPGARSLDGEAEERFWHAVREAPARFLAHHPEAAVVRVSTTLSGVRQVFERAVGPVIGRAGTGVSYVYFSTCHGATSWVEEAAGLGLRCAIEMAPPDVKPTMDLWPAPGDDLEMMRAIKRMFDPEGLLNRGRMYGRI